MNKLVCKQFFRAKLGAKQTHVDPLNPNSTTKNLVEPRTKTPTRLSPQIF